MIRCSERYLNPVFMRMHELLLSHDVIQQNEMPVKVSKDGRPANSNSYMWVYRTGKYHKEAPMVLYDYQKTRKTENPERFLKGFHGICVSDTYSVYESMDKTHPEITFAFCHTMEGINYYLNHEKQLKVFLDHGNVPLDNNAITMQQKGH